MRHVLCCLVSSLADLYFYVSSSKENYIPCLYTTFLYLKIHKLVPELISGLDGILVHKQKLISCPKNDYFSKKSRFSVSGIRCLEISHLVNK